MEEKNIKTEKELMDEIKRLREMITILESSKRYQENLTLNMQYSNYILSRIDQYALEESRAVKDRVYSAIRLIARLLYDGEYLDYDKNLHYINSAETLLNYKKIVDEILPPKQK